MDDRLELKIGYLWFPVGTDEKKARARFKERFGYEPTKKKKNKIGLYLGPIKKQKKDGEK